MSGTERRRGREPSHDTRSQPDHRPQPLLPRHGCAV